MKRSFGLYRRTFGAIIVESFYDFETCTIGPYTIPVQIDYSPNMSSGNSFSKYRYYQLMNQYPEVLAVFNNNNYCFVAITRNCVDFLPYYTSDLYYKKQKLPSFVIDPPLQIPTYQHVGYIKTYQECKAIYTWPWKLLGDLSTYKLFDFDCSLSGSPLENPPLSLYKYLIDTDYSAVYFDLDKNSPVFI